MSTGARIAYMACALAALGVVAWLSFKDESPVVPPTTGAFVPVAEPVSESAPVAESGPASRSYATDAEIPYAKLTTVAKVENRVIYTFSAMGEPMEIHPDGLVVIYNHKKVIRYADGREETRYVTVRARPKTKAVSELPAEAFR